MTLVDVLVAIQNYVLCQILEGRNNNDIILVKVS